MIQPVEMVAPRTPTVLTGASVLFSAADGYAFIKTDQNLTSYIGMKISISYDYKTIVGYLKAAGPTVETYGSELVTNGGFESVYEKPGYPWGYWREILPGYFVWVDGYDSMGLPYNWTMAMSEDGEVDKGITPYGLWWLTARPQGSQPGWWYQQLTHGADWLLKFGAYIVYNTAQGKIEYSSVASSVGQGVIIATGTSGSVTATGYICPSYANGYVLLYPGAWNGSAIFDEISFKQVTAPATNDGTYYGFKIVSSSGGTTYNWASDTGINKTAVTGYVITVYP